jgi:hypothetical protein
VVTTTPPPLRHHGHPWPIEVPSPCCWLARSHISGRLLVLFADGQSSSGDAPHFIRFSRWLLLSPSATASSRYVLAVPDSRVTSRAASIPITLAQPLTDLTFGPIHRPPGLDLTLKTLDGSASRTWFRGVLVGSGERPAAAHILGHSLIFLSVLAFIQFPTVEIP